MLTNLNHNFLILSTFLCIMLMKGHTDFSFPSSFVSPFLSLILCYLVKIHLTWVSLPLSWNHLKNLYYFCCLLWYYLSPLHYSPYWTMRMFIKMCITQLLALTEQCLTILSNKIHYSIVAMLHSPIKLDSEKHDYFGIKSYKFVRVNCTVLSTKIYLNNHYSLKITTMFKKFVYTFSSLFK